MTTQEHLERIKAKCSELLAIAEKRTPGKWQEGGWSRQIKTGRERIHVEHKGNHAFIAACAGPAEAGWRATIAAIEMCDKLRRMFPPRNNAMLSAMITEQESDIIAAWLKELL